MLHVHVYACMYIVTVHETQRSQSTVSPGRSKLAEPVVQGPPKSALQAPIHFVVYSFMVFTACAGANLGRHGGQVGDREAHVNSFRFDLL